jgi:hypothetical protein
MMFLNFVSTQMDKIHCKEKMNTHQLRKTQSQQKTHHITNRNYIFKNVIRLANFLIISII